MGVRGDESILICSAIRHNIGVRRTDRQTSSDSIILSVHSITWGKTVC